MSSPTQRTLALLRREGWRCAIVEKWNPHARIRQDLFGFIDILCIRGEETLAVQACNYSDVSKRIKKIEDADALADVRAAGWGIEVHGWHKVKNRYQCRRVDIS